MKWGEDGVSSAALLRKVFDSVEDAIFLIGPPHRGIVQVCNAAVQAIFGYRPQEIMGGTTEPLHVDRASFERFGRISEPVLDRSGRFSTEYPLKRRDGTVFQASVTVTVLDEEKGWHGGVVSVVRDVSHRKTAEEELRRSEARYRTIFETAGAAMAIIEDDTTVSLVNTEFEDLSGYPREEVEGRMSFTAFVAPECRQRMLAFHDRRRHGDTDVPEVYEAEVTDRDGARHVVLVTVGMIPRSTTSVASFLDVTEHRRTTEELRWFRAALDTAGDAVFIIDRATMRFVDVNATACRSLGYSAEELRAMGPQDITPDYSEDQLRDVFDRLIEEDAVEQLVTVHVRKDGARFPVELNLSALPDHGHSLVVSSVRDITERRRLEREQEELKHLARQSQKLESIGTLAGGVAHEINNPINGIMNYAQLIRDGLRTGDEIDVQAVSDSEARTIDTFAEEIIAETERVARIVRSLLQFARHDKQSRSPARLCDIVESALTLVRTILRRDRIHLDVDVPEDLPKVRCRSQQIQQVIMNLVTNARDALNEKYPSHHEDKVIRLSAESREAGGDLWVRLTVEDRGPGISDQVKERMFDPFYTTKARQEGTGLGLAILHGIVTEHGGTVQVQSEPGSYTRFHIDLPVDGGR